ncbi:MAG TPA: hypothetical protein VF756_11235 [Thermoanaerobaculia bacterium]
MARKSRNSDLDEGIAGLYAGSLGEFTAARNSLAKQLQKEGRRDEADEVKSLPKPSISAWAVNRLFQDEREKMDELVSVGERAREALRHTLTHGEAEALREALQEERALRDDLRRRAGEILKGEGRAASQAVLDRVTVNLDALALSPAAAEEAERGWLSHDLEPPGFEVLAGLQIAAGGRDRRGLRLVPSPPPAKRKPEKKKAAPAKKAPAERAAAKKVEAETRKEEAARAREEAAERARREREEERNRDRIARAQEKVATAEAEADTLRLEVERAERAEAEAAKAVEEAQRRARDAKAAAERARARAERAGRDLARAEERLERVRRMSG